MSNKLNDNLTTIDKKQLAMLERVYTLASTKPEINLMSGGSYNYQYTHIQALAEAIRQGAGNNVSRVLFADLLDRCVSAAKQIEWVDSGDRARGTEDEYINACLLTSPKALSEKDQKALAFIREAASKLEALENPPSYPTREEVGNNGIQYLTKIYTCNRPVRVSDFPKLQPYDDAENCLARLLRMELVTNLGIQHEKFLPTTAWTLTQKGYNFIASLLAAPPFEPSDEYDT